MLAKDLEYFMESKNIQKAAMIGHSMGGIAVMILALRAVCNYVFHNSSNVLLFFNNVM